MMKEKEERSLQYILSEYIRACLVCKFKPQFSMFKCWKMWTQKKNCIWQEGLIKCLSHSSQFKVFKHCIREHLKASFHILSNNVEWYYCNYLKNCGTHKNMTPYTKQMALFSLFHTFVSLRNSSLSHTIRTLSTFSFSCGWTRKFLWLNQKFLDQKISIFLSLVVEPQNTQKYLFHDLCLLMCSAWKLVPLSGSIGLKGPLDS